jgi:predicted SAM-dependent methyltransferase
MNLLLKYADKIGRKLGLKRCRGYQIVQDAVRGKTGIEIGGPSQIFGAGGILPIYSVIAALHDSNYSPVTLWQKTVPTQLGTKLISEATAISVCDSVYDFVLASHVLEHTANPMLALLDWKRVLKPNGIMVVVVPDPKYTFDHRRPITSLAHLEQDYEEAMHENDQTHFKEIIRLHDLSRDPWAGDSTQFKNRCLQNKKFRSMHHHVFSMELIKQLVEKLHLEVLHSTTELPFHTIVMCRK